MTCRWNGSGNPRVLAGRHGDDCPGEECAGCLTCAEEHCRVCGRAHADGTCAECLGASRDDLHTIATLCGALPVEAKIKGVNSEAAMLWGPTADPSAWNRRSAALLLSGKCSHFGDPESTCPDDVPPPNGPACEKCKHPSCLWIRGDRYRCPEKVAWIADARDEAHPLWVLGTWEQAYRDHFEQPTDLTATLPRLVDYLDRQMHVMAQVDDVPFEDFARDLRGCRAYIEDVLSEGEREETGAPCPECGKHLVKSWGNTAADDKWKCSSRACRRWYSDEDYRRRITDDYRANSDKLTAPDMQAEHRVRASSVRAWASLGKVRKRGKDRNGRQLYDVADVVTMRDRDDRQSA